MPYNLGIQEGTAGQGRYVCGRRLKCIPCIKFQGTKRSKVTLHEFTEHFLDLVLPLKITSYK